MKKCKTCEQYLETELNFDISSFTSEGIPRYLSSCAPCRSKAVSDKFKLKRYEANPENYNICDCGNILAKKYFKCKECGATNRE
jgi:hypothetical protein